MRKRIPIAIGAAAAAVGALVVTPSALASPADGPDDAAGRVIRAADPIAGRYIVVLKEDSGLSKSSVGARAESVAEEHGGKVRDTYRTALKGYAASMTAEQARRTASDPRVDYVQQDGVQHSSGTQKNPPSWGLDRVDQKDNDLDKSYTYPNTAKNVTVYMVDTGIRMSHEQFGGRASKGENFASDEYSETCMNHGSHTAGTVAGKDYGIAKEAKIVSVRVLNCDDSASDSDIIKAADWVTADAAKHPDSPAVVNMSINSNGQTVPAEDKAIKKSIADGVTWVVSAGNAGSDACQNSPGNIDEALVVNNATKDDARAQDSNFGKCTDLFAPGTDIMSASTESDTATATMSGTSMAAPHVAGAAALYRSAHPKASPAEAQKAILDQATTGAIGDLNGSPDRLLLVK